MIDVWFASFSVLVNCFFDAAVAVDAIVVRPMLSVFRKNGDGDEVDAPVVVSAPRGSVAYVVEHGRG